MSTAITGPDLPRQPVTVADERIGLNAAFAAAMTRGVGSMPALYLTLAFVTGWTALATWGPLRGVDSYPFAFLLFLDNVIQLVLCSVILVGQRVLGMAADRRAVQTYQRTEAIFAEVAGLQGHLDRQDRTLSRGVSLLETSPHPWIQRHRVQPPPQAIDHVVGINGRIAARLTQQLGSMWAFYLSAGTQIAWIGLAAVGVQRFDPYPFAFMTFLSTFAQLIFMIVIMVGQDVLGHAADRRSEQTFADTEAILHECRRMQARLTAQDRVIDTLADYTTFQVTEHLAQAIRTAQQDAAGWGRIPGSAATPHPWGELSDQLREPYRVQARNIGEQLATIGCLMVPASGPSPGFAFTEEEVWLLARLEHERLIDERSAEVILRPGRQGAASGLVPWDELPDLARTEMIKTVGSIPALLADVGFQVLREDTGARHGVGEADFPSQEWAILEQALMAASMLVALAEGVAEAEEMFAMARTLREVSATHPRRFIRELAAACDFRTGLQPGTKFRHYLGPALETIRTATTIISERAPDELVHFREFLAETTAAVADANNEGGFFGLGARPRTPREARAMEAVQTATEIEK